MAGLEVLPRMSPKQLLLVLVILATSAVSTEAAFKTSSFVSKVNNGFERLVISVDEYLAMPVNSGGSGSNFGLTSTSGSNGLGSYGKGATQDCGKVVQQLKELIAKTSDLLYKATHGETYFRQVSILLPPNWASTNCTGGAEVSTATYQTSSAADVSVTADHPVFVDKPWTTQYGPCGAPGKKISVPVSFLEADKEIQARLMLREWIKFRYGVFDENGFAHDEKYPGEFTGEDGKPVQTACHLNRSTSASSASSATSASAPGDCKNGGKCEASRKSSVNLGAGARKSIMSLPLDENNVNELCSSETHVRTTPTKHNFLCDGRSVWEVMKQHGDFINMDDRGRGRNGENTLEPQEQTGTAVPPGVGRNFEEGSAPGPVFNFVTAKSHRIIFLLDRTNGMNQTNRWFNLRRSLYRTFQYLPSGVELGVISYTNSSTLSLPLTLTTTHNRDSLLGRIPLKPLPEDGACVSCALKAAVKLIKSSNEDVGPTTLVLVNGSPSKSMSREWEKVAKIIEGTPLRTVVVTYTNDSSELLGLAQYGGLFKIPDVQHHNSNLEQTEYLNNIFLQVINENIGTPVNKVFETVQWPDTDWQSEGKFTIEESLGRNTYVTVTTEEWGDVDELQLISPSGKAFGAPIQAEGLVVTKIPGVSEAGLWSYTIKFYQSQSPRPVSIDVITEARRTESISVKFWNQVLEPSTDASTAAEVVLLYAEVLQGDLPVLNANVTATVTLPGNKVHGPRWIQVRLVDSGSGDADITWGDGIYSAYFTQLGSKPGLFSVTLNVNDNEGQAVVPVHTNITRGSLGVANCCGSNIPHIATVPTGSFSRKVAGASFEIKAGVPFGYDPYPPGRITDLKVERVVETASEVKLSWTAPGGDFDKGKASKYEIRCYTSREALMNDNFGAQGILVHSSLTPEPESSGTRQSCTVGVPWANEVFYYGIVSVDGALNRAKVSNLISVLIKEAPTSTLKVHAWEDDDLVNNLTWSRSLPRNDGGLLTAGATWFRQLNPLELYLLIGGAAVFLLLISTFILVLVCVRRGKPKASSSAEAPPAYHNIYVGVGKGPQGGAAAGPGGVQGKDGLCCWENESDKNTKDSNNRNGSNTESKLNGINNPYITDNATSSYIPASALCAPNGIYRDMYSGGSQSTNQTHVHDGSSVDSKQSDGGSHETVHVTDGHHTPASFYGHPSQTLQMMASSPMRSQQPQQQFESIPGALLGYTSMRASEYGMAGDDGGFNISPNSDSGFHKIVAEFDSPGVMNGSAYGGSVMSIPSSSKKRTRHISFV